MTIKNRPAALAGRLAMGAGLVCALVVPATATGADNAPKLADYKARALVVATGPTTATVCVGTAKKSTNKRSAAWRGLPVVLDLTAARIGVHDVNGDGLKNLADLQIGDRIKLSAKLPENLVAGLSPFAAQKVSVSYKSKVKPKDGFAGGVCPEWTDDEDGDVDDDIDLGDDFTGGIGTY